MVERIGTAAHSAGAGPVMTTSRVSRVAKRAALVVVSFLLAQEIGLRIRNPFPFLVRRRPYRAAGAPDLHDFPPGCDQARSGHARHEEFAGVSRSGAPARLVAPVHLADDRRQHHGVFVPLGRQDLDRSAGRRVSAVRPDVWINNAGFEGHSTFGHIVLLREFVMTMHPTMALFLTSNDGARLVGDIVFSQLRPWLEPGTRS